uniref:Uncharacterized protein n=1 Tax=Glossina pallidipes TaxID=7398 RepID=A0A1A9ZD62_GLOPL
MCSDCKAILLNIWSGDFSRNVNLFSKFIKCLQRRLPKLKYVVNPPPKQKIAFGTTLPRLVLPVSGPCLSSFVRAHQGNGSLSPGPAAYFPSLVGFSAFASTRLPPPRITKSRYDFLDEVLKPIKVAPKPFNVGAKRMPGPTFLTPPPSAYACDKPTLKLKISSAFGSEHKYIPLVEMKCFPHNIVVCAECGQTPIGDYWHNANDNQDICRTCMDAKKTIFHSCQIDNTKRRALRRKLEEYRYRRYCSFFHNHNGTTAAEQIMPTKTLIYKINLENYLSQYITRPKLKRVHSKDLLLLLATPQGYIAYLTTELRLSKCAEELSKWAKADQISQLCLSNCCDARVLGGESSLLAQKQHILENERQFSSYCQQFQEKQKHAIDIFYKPEIFNLFRISIFYYVNKNENLQQQAHVVSDLQQQFT